MKVSENLIDFSHLWAMIIIFKIKNVHINCGLKCHIIINLIVCIWLWKIIFSVLIQLEASWVASNGGSIFTTSIHCESHSNNWPITKQVRVRPWGKEVYNTLGFFLNDILLTIFCNSVFFHCYFRIFSICINSDYVNLPRITFFKNRMLQGQNLDLLQRTMLYTFFL